MSGGGRGRRRRVVVALLATPWALWALARTLELDRFHPAVALMSFTPLVAATAIVPLIVALVTREWVVGAVAAVALALLVVAVAPRALGGPQLATDATKGRRLVVMAANLKFGQADPRAIVRLVREQHVDVLSLEELTPEAVAGLDAAGIRRLLPGRVLRARERAAGTGLMARRPLVAVRTPGGASLQASLALGGSDELRLVSVHPYPPLTAARVRTWTAVLRALPAPRADGVRHVLMGDFNATLDHRELRRVLDRGYTDAADATGEGLVPTFPVGTMPSLITIDHVLVPRGILVRRLSVQKVARSDHRAVIAELVLPGT